jgi:predicted regulator of Ras-like GTPase activity (Roadblock/LC7/MglB family)
VDYYFLLLRAVKSLPQSTPEARQAVYQRARSALRSHLRSFEPPLTQTDIATQERVLEEAVARVEAQTKKKPVLLSSIEMPEDRAVRTGGGGWLSDLLTRASREDAPAPEAAKPALSVERPRPVGLNLQQLLDDELQAPQEEAASKLKHLNKVLEKLQSESPGVEASAVISKDGLVIASSLSPSLEETRIASVTATLVNLGGRAAAELARGEIREVIVRGDRGYAVMVSAGRGALLLALTDESSRLGLVFFDMHEAAKGLGNVL